MRTTLLVLTTLFLACATDPQAPPAGAAADPAPDPGTEAPALEADGFPCDVHAVLETYCAACHAGETYAPEFLTPAAVRTAIPDVGSYGDLMLVRMQDPDRPMPPAYVTQRPAAADRDVIARWVAAGMPTGACGPLTRP